MSVSVGRTDLEDGRYALLRMQLAAGRTRSHDESGDSGGLEPDAETPASLDRASVAVIRLIDRIE